MPADGAAVADMLAAEYELYGRAYIRLMAAVDGSPALAAMAERGRVEHRRWLEDTFGHRLPADSQQRECTLAALDAASDVGTWRLLRSDLGYDAQTTIEVLRMLIDGAPTVTKSDPPDRRSAKLRVSEFGSIWPSLGDAWASPGSTHEHRIPAPI